MTKNTSIYIILNFLLLILFIDIYVSFNVKNKEQFLVNEINDENIVNIINLICKLDVGEKKKSRLDEKDFYKHRLNLVNFLMKEHRDNIEKYFRKINKNVQTDELLELYTTKNSEFNELKNNIDNIKTYEKEFKKRTIKNLVSEQSIIENAENKLFVENINIKNIVDNYLMQQNNKNKKDRKIISDNLNILSDNTSCKKIIKFLIVYYMKNLHSINENNNYKISYLSVLQDLIDNNLNC